MYDWYKKLSAQERKVSCEDKNKLATGRALVTVFWSYKDILHVD